MKTSSTFVIAGRYVVGARFAGSALMLALLTCSRDDSGAGVGDHARGFVENVSALALEIQDDVSFGSIQTGEPGRQEIPIRNRGDKPIEIVSIKSSCGCMSSFLRRQSMCSGEVFEREVSGSTAMTLMPGERAVLGIVLAASNRPGVVHKQIKVLTSEACRGEYVVSVVANVFEAVRRSPDVVEFGVVYSHVVAEKTVQVVFVNDQNVRILGAKSDNNVVSVKIGSDFVREGDRVIPLRVTMYSTMRLGEVRASVVLDSTSLVAPHVEIPITADVEAPVSVVIDSPDSEGFVDFGVVSPGVSSKRKMWIRNEFPEIQFRVLGVRCESNVEGEVTCGVERDERGVSEVWLLLSPSAATRFVRGECIVSVDHPEISEKRVQFRGWVRSR